MSLALLLACFAEPEEQGVDAELAIAQPAPPPDFDYRGDGVPLVPDFTDFHAQLAAKGLADPAARHAAEVQYKPDVMVAKIAATRTGAELGALFVEAGAGELPVMVARAQRIRDGLNAINEGGPAVQGADELIAWLLTDPPREQMLRELDERSDVAIDQLGEHAGDEFVPLVMAGAWLQAYDLVALAMEETANPSAGELLLAQPMVGAYFRSYTTSVGKDFLPVGMNGPLMDSLDKLERATDHQPMTPEDVASIREATESLLGMM